MEETVIEKHPFVVDSFDKRVVRNAIRDGRADFNEYQKHLAALEDIDPEADIDIIELDQDEEIEKRADRRKRLMQSRRIHRARARVMGADFMPALGGHKPRG